MFHFFSEISLFLPFVFSRGGAESSLARLPLLRTSALPKQAKSASAEANCVGVSLP